MKRFFEDLRVYNDYETPESVVTKKTANKFNIIPGNTYAKQHYGYESSQLLYFNGIEATYLLRMWDPNTATLSTTVGRPNGETAAINTQLINSTKRVMTQHYNAGVILGNKVIVRVSFISRQLNSWACSVCLDRYSEWGDITVTWRNGAIWFNGISADGSIVN
jgi:hypothetical protein